MPQISISGQTYGLVAVSQDKNKNGFVEELNMSQNVRNEIDSNRDNKISNSELKQGLSNNSVEIKGNNVVRNMKTNSVSVYGLQNLKVVNNIADNSIQHSWKHSWNHLEGSDRVRQLNANNYEYAYQIREMKSALFDIKREVSGLSDSTSSSIRRDASNALIDSSLAQTWDFIDSVFEYYDRSGSIYDDPFSGGGSSFDDPFSGGGSVTDDPFSGGGSATDDPFDNPNYVDTRHLENRNARLRYAYNELNGALKRIESQTDNLPDINKAITRTDNSITSALNDISAIKNSSQTPDQVKAKLEKLSVTETGKIKGNAGTLGLTWGAGGAVAGGVTGYLISKNVKGALIGASVGGLLVGGIRGGIAAAKDKGHERKATELNKLANDVVNYNPDQEQSKLVNSANDLYNSSMKARGNQNIDSARSHASNINTIGNKVSTISTTAARILSAYKM